MTAHSPPTTPLAVELADRGIHARTLARAAGVHENSVYNWAAGKATPTTARAARVAATLGIPVDRVFPGRIDPPRPTRPAARPRVLPAARPVEQLTEQDRAALPRRLAELMARRELSSRALAEATQLHPATIDRWLAGDRLPSPDAAARVAEALDIPVAQLLPAAATATPLRAAAAQRGWGPRQLARSSGVDEDAVKGYLAGTRTPLIPNATRLANALDRPLDELFDLTRSQPLPPPQPGPPHTLTPAEVLEVPATGRPDWRDDAACAAPDTDPEQWWPSGDDPAFQARATCAGCPVLGDCRDAYLTSPDSPEDRTAIWAGLPGGRLHTLARAAARDPRASDAAPRRERARNEATSSSPPSTRDRDTATRPAHTPRQRDPSAAARVSRDTRARVASDRADSAPVRARTADTGISL